MPQPSEQALIDTLALFDSALINALIICIVLQASVVLLPMPWSKVHAVVYSQLPAGCISAMPAWQQSKLVEPG
jgi:hypothetical protein